MNEAKKGALAESYRKELMSAIADVRILATDCYASFPCLEMTTSRAGLMVDRELTIEHPF